MLVIAHRGASGCQPENTLLAFKEALNMGVDAIELDVHMVEGELVVIHDRWLHKTTSGQGRLSDFSFQSLRLLDAGKGQLVPTLWEALSLIRGHCDINIELKSSHCLEPLIELLVAAIESLNFQLNQFLISSFNHRLLQTLKSRWPELYIAPLIACCPVEYAQFAAKLQAYSVHIDVDFVEADFVRDAHQRGLKVFVYTVDEVADILDMQAMGVDGIFTNYPDRSLVALAHDAQLV